MPQSIISNSAQPNWQNLLKKMQGADLQSVNSTPIKASETSNDDLLPTLNTPILRSSLITTANQTASRLDALQAEENTYAKSRGLTPPITTGATGYMESVAKLQNFINDKNTIIANNKKAITNAQTAFGKKFGNFVGGLVNTSVENYNKNTPSGNAGMVISYKNIF